MVTISNQKKTDMHGLLSDYVSLYLMMNVISVKLVENLINVKL